MGIWAIIPVKPLHRAKSRLQHVLSSGQRAELAEAMFTQLLSVVTKIEQLAGIIVISKDTKAISIARNFKAKTILEGGQSDLNSALSRATEVARVWGAEAIMILPADLPFLREQDVMSLISAGREEPSIVIAPDNNRYGTNALLIRPPGFMDYAFGDRSFNKHRFLALELGATVHVYESKSLALDVDTPKDLEDYHHMLMFSQYDHLPHFYTHNAG